MDFFPLLGFLQSHTRSFFSSTVVPFLLKVSRRNFRQFERFSFSLKIHGHQLFPFGTFYEAAFHCFFEMFLLICNDVVIVCDLLGVKRANCHLSFKELFLIQCIYLYESHS